MLHVVAATPTHSPDNVCRYQLWLGCIRCAAHRLPSQCPFQTPDTHSHECRFQLWDAYGVLPTVCGIKDKTGGCTYAGVQAESSANCIMPLEAVIDRLGALKVGDKVGGGGRGGGERGRQKGWGTEGTREGRTGEGEPQVPQQKCTAWFGLRAYGCDVQPP